jgi:energy-coupling factor transport system ATP-binding protein
VRQGEVLGIVGATGAGKTTLCRVFNGIVPQVYGGRFFGYAHVAGLDTLTHPVSALARHVGVVLEDPEVQLTATTVEDEVAFALENLRVARPEMRARIRWALAAVGLEGTEHRHPHTLSGGEKQRLAIAAALALRPHLLVLDEPTSQLDPAGAASVFATLRRQERVTVVLASHAAEELAAYADRVALLAAGELVAVGPPAAILGDVARLRAHGVRPPQVAETFSHLRERGAAVPETPVRLSQGVARLQDLWRSGQCHRAQELTRPPSPPRQGAPFIAVQDLHHTYPDGTQALQGVSLEVRAGEYVLIVGENGAGKTTLVKHLLGLLHPTAGRVTVDGADTRDLRVSDLARRLGYVAQNPDRQIFNATVEDEVAFALRHRGHPPAEVAARVERALAAMGLTAHRRRHPLALPKGDRARVVVAAVLAMQPAAIVFDEPTTGQDPAGARHILDVSRTLHRRGQTVLVITHHLYLMPQYAERVIVMGRGTVLLDAPLREAFAALAGLPDTNLLPPQAVQLAQALDADLPLLTPAEVAAWACDGAGAP